MDLRTKFNNWLIEFTKNCTGARRITLVYNGSDNYLPCGHHISNYKEYRHVEFCQICREELTNYVKERRHAKNG